MIIYIKPVEYCNLKCLHCYNAPKYDNIDFQAVKEFLKELNSNICDNYFVLHGGEPLLAPPGETLDLIRHFPNNNWRITTNLCVELTKERLKILCMMDEVRTSFDVKMRFGGMCNLMLWLKNVRTLRSLGINIYVNVCLSTMLLKKNPHKLLKMLNNLGIFTLSFERITHVGGAAHNEYIIPTYADVDEWLCELYKSSKAFPRIRIRTFEDVMFGLNKDEKNCRASTCCKSTMTINADGTIGVCPNDAQVRTIGTVDSDMKELLAGKCKSSYSTKKECLACDKFSQCFGGCAQLEWQGDVCPYPHKLADLMKGGE